MDQVPPCTFPVVRIKPLPGIWPTTTYICEDLTDDDAGREKLRSWFEVSVKEFAAAERLDRVGVVYTAAKSPGGRWEAIWKLADPADRRIELA